MGYDIGGVEVVAVAIISSNERGKSCTIIRSGKVAEISEVLAAPDLQRKVLPVTEGMRYFKRVMEAWEKGVDGGEAHGNNSPAD